MLVVLGCANLLDATISFACCFVVIVLDLKVCYSPRQLAREPDLATFREQQLGDIESYASSQPQNNLVLNDESNVSLGVVRSASPLGGSSVCFKISHWHCSWVQICLLFVNHNETLEHNNHKLTLVYTTCIPNTLVSW